MSFTIKLSSKQLLSPINGAQLKKTLSTKKHEKARLCMNCLLFITLATKYTNDNIRELNSASLIICLKIYLS